MFFSYSVIVAHRKAAVVAREATLRGRPGSIEKAAGDPAAEQAWPVI